MLPDAIAAAPCSTAHPRTRHMHEVGRKGPQVPRGLTELTPTFMPVSTPPPAAAPRQVHLHLRPRHRHVGQSAFLVVHRLLLTGPSLAEGQQALFPAGDED